MMEKKTKTIGVTVDMPFFELIAHEARTKQLPVAQYCRMVIADRVNKARSTGIMALLADVVRRYYNLELHSSETQENGSQGENQGVTEK
jgi:hypothetical protein